MPPRPQKASVLIIVLVTIVFVSAALVALVQRASDDLLVPTREADASHLRGEAYSALETTLAVLVDFKTVNNGLHSPSEGWADPLNWVSFTPLGEGNEVHVTFEDESGKMSLPNTTTTSMNYFFTNNCQLGADDASMLTESLFTWIKKNYQPTSSSATTPAQYEEDTLPFQPPMRSLRTWDELRSIDGVSGLFFDAKDHLTPLGKEFVSAFSLYTFTASNINAGNPDTIACLGGVNMTTSGVQNIVNYVTNDGAGNTTASANTNQSNTYYTSASDAAQTAGITSLPTTLGVTISALRIYVTVKHGASLYTLNALVSWAANGGGAAAGGGGAATGGGAAGGGAAGGRGGRASNAPVNNGNLRVALVSAPSTTTTSDTVHTAAAAARGGGTATATATTTALANPVAQPALPTSAPTGSGVTATVNTTANTYTTSPATATVALKYPYTILEISESDIDPAAQKASTTATTESFSNVFLPPPTT